MEMRRIVASGILSGAMLTGGVWAAHEGLDRSEHITHLEACQEPAVANTPKCNDVGASDASKFEGDMIVATVEGFGGVGLALVGGLGLIATASSALGRDLLR